MTRLVTVVDMATVWTSPEAPREVDEPAVRDAPDPTAWVDALDAETRMGLHGRTLTQLLRGEPVDVIGDGPPGWLEVAAPWQPAPEHDDGYHGWIRSAHVAEAASGRGRRRLGRAARCPPTGWPCWPRRARTWGCSTCGEG